MPIEIVLYGRVMKAKTLQVGTEGSEITNLSFELVDIQFNGGSECDIFAKKNNKSLVETLNHKRYLRLKAEITSRYHTSLNMPLGEFLLERKLSGDSVYKKFLNRYGDLRYSKFFITDPVFLTVKGLYVYFSNEELKYIGRCRDSIKKRVNQGYGKIHPKNCYLDGQATNCRINSLITEASEVITLWFCRLESDEIIERLERILIQNYDPPWNIQK